MRKLVLIRVAIVLIGIATISVFVHDVQKTRFLIDNSTNLANVEAQIFASGTLVFDGTLAQNMVRTDFSERLKANIGKTDIILVEVLLPDFQYSKVVYLDSKRADYISIRIHHSSNSLKEFDVYVSSMSRKEAREYKLSGI